MLGAGQRERRYPSSRMLIGGDDGYDKRRYCLPLLWEGSSGGGRTTGGTVSTEGGKGYEVSDVTGRVHDGESVLGPRDVDRT